MKPALSVVAIALVLATGITAQQGIEDPSVQARIAAMRGNRAALDTLGGMLSGSVAFSPSLAAIARTHLITTTGDIPALFRKNRQDPLSSARPAIWTNWSDFRNRARIARVAASRLRTGSVASLRRTLPALLSACLECHQVYRKPRPAPFRKSP